MREKFLFLRTICIICNKTHKRSRWGARRYIHISTFPKSAPRFTRDAGWVCNIEYMRMKKQEIEEGNKAEQIRVCFPCYSHLKYWKWNTGLNPQTALPWNKRSPQVSLPIVFSKDKKKKKELGNWRNIRKTPEGVHWHRRWTGIVELFSNCWEQLWNDLVHQDPHAEIFFRSRNQRRFRSRVNKLHFCKLDTPLLQKRLFGHIVVREKNFWPNKMHFSPWKSLLHNIVPL